MIDLLTWQDMEGIYYADLDGEIITGKTLYEFAENVKKWFIAYWNNEL